MPDGIVKFDSGESSEMKSILRRIDFVAKKETSEIACFFFGK